MPRRFQRIPPLSRRLRQRALQPRDVAAEIQKLAVDHRGHFVDGVRKNEPAIKDRDLRFVFGQIFPIQIDNSAHVYSTHSRCLVDRIRRVPSKRQFNSVSQKMVPISGSTFG